MLIELTHAEPLNMMPLIRKYEPSDTYEQLMIAAREMPPADCLAD